MITERIKNKKPIYPLFTMLFSIAMILYGMIMADSFTTLIVFAAVLLLLICYGYFFTVLFWLPVAILFCGIFGGITYAISQDIGELIKSITRMLGISIAVIPGLGLSVSHLTRSLESLKIPRFITLGIMITYAFFPILYKEIKQIREAMKVRKTTNIFNPKILYRAFLIPLIIQLINISDTLSLSIETRGFSMYDKNYISYKKVGINWLDFMFMIFIITFIVLGIVYANALNGVITW